MTDNHMLRYLAVGTRRVNSPKSSVIHLTEPIVYNRSKDRDIQDSGHTLGIPPLLTSDPYTMLFCRNGKVSLQHGLLSQRFSLLVAIDLFFAMKIVLWP
jgi:hypothetical protein